MFLLFFFNDTATTEIYTLSLHDALPISVLGTTFVPVQVRDLPMRRHKDALGIRVAGQDLLTPGIALDSRLHVDRLKDRKSTRLNSSHANISYAVFCLKKKKNEYSIRLQI